MIHSSKSLVVSHKVHGKKISRHTQQNESVILPQYLISHCVITSSEGGFSSTRTRFITAVQDFGPSVGFDVKQQSPQRHRK